MKQQPSRAGAGRPLVIAIAAATLAACSGGAHRSAAPPAGGHGAAVATAAHHTTPQVTEHYADVGDIRIFYKEAGAGTPVVFLHGGFGSSAEWDRYFPLLADAYRVIAPDSRGQGRTSIGSGPITYGRMAADVIGLLDRLGIERAHVVGYSDGGCIALHLLTDYPDRVLSATLIGTPYHLDNYSAEGFEQLRSFIAGLEAGDPAHARRKAAYEAGAADPAAWPELVKRLGRTWLSQPTFGEAELRSIETPVLVVKVSRDEFLPPAVFDRTAELIPGARVLDLGEGTHRIPREQPERLAQGIRAFIEAVGSASTP